MRIEYYGERRTRLWFNCPRKEGRECMVLLKPWPINIPTWDWDGNEAAPTLTPSIDCQSCGWHGHIVAGKLVPAE